MGYIFKLIVTVLFFITKTAIAQTVPGIFSKTYGDKTNQAVVYIHGGPGFDSQNFEYTTAQKLADSGFFVVVYDQRGQGRSTVVTNPEVYKYKSYADDLKSLIDALGISKPILIGHSHGGPIALKFEEYYPDVAKKIILAAAPVNFWNSMLSILENCSKKYANEKNTIALADLEHTFQKLNENNILFMDEVNETNNAFQHALKCGLYNPKSPNQESYELNKIVAEKYIKPAPENVYYPMGNFIFYEKYTRADYSDFILKNSSKIFAVYGEEDGLFSDKTLEGIRLALFANKSAWAFTILKGSSHSLFIDQQTLFINTVSSIAAEQ